MAEDAPNIRAARAFLFKRNIKGIAPNQFAHAASEMKVDFGELLYLIGLMADGPASSTQHIGRVIDNEYLKLEGAQAAISN